VTDQIWTLDKSRMISPIGRLGDTELRSVEKAIKIHLGSS
jgi:mRNA-degrading endonuclease toxin of MazEF toxin-antitoxin module